MDDSIPFPFPPYPQQRDLMKSMMHCIESSSVGCFESPTGTGKSLSTICATLSWQFKEEERILEEQSVLALKRNSGNGDDWLMAFQTGFVSDTAELKRTRKAYDLHLAMKGRILRTISSNQRRGSTQFGKFGSAKVDQNSKSAYSPSTVSTKEPEDEFSLKHYDSDDERASKPSAAHRRTANNDDGEFEDEDEDEDKLMNPLCLPKIFYCSRTHSQISQFVGEIKRTAFANARCITLGSRRNMCINSDVMSYGSDSKMSEVCLEMHKSKSKKDILSDNILEPSARRRKTAAVAIKPCPFHNKSKEQEFADHALGAIRDIESLTKLGDDLEACPYYATRRALRDAQVVCMPYNMLLLDDLRNSMGIDLSNSVVIFDEAHNLVEAVNHIYSADVSYSQLDLASHSVAEYSMRFQSTLTGKNYYYVTLLLSVIKSLLQCLKADKNDTKTVSSTPLTANIPGTGSKVLGANDFLFSCGLDNVNMFKLRKHITDTNLVNKVGGYAEHQAKKRAAANAELAVITLTVTNKNRKNNHHNSSLEGNKTASSSSASSSASSSSSSVPSFSSSASATAISSENKASSEGQDYTLGGYTHALRGVLALITCLTNADIDGRIVINTGTNTDKGTGKSASIPSEGSNADNSINSSASSIRFILLNPSVHFQKIVDKARSVLLLGGTLRPFAYLKSFLFPRVSTDKIILFACGHVVSKKNVLSLVASCGPKGNNLEFTHDTRLQANSISELHCALKEINKVVPNGVVVFFASYQYMGSVIAKWKALGVYGELESGRPLYTEPRHASDADNVWVEYSKKAVAEGGPGAMLFCVMGGKLSEGINFSDKLARCVVVIGMPYPDGRDTVLREKLKFANIIENDEKAGNRLYEAMCMRTVNQCIGRSIRHVNDYAAIVLLDTRYSQQRVNAQLPIWLNSDVAHCTSFSNATFKLRTFFASHLT